MSQGRDEMPSTLTKGQKFMVTALIIAFALLGVFSTIRYNRLLENEEKSSFEFNQKQLAKLAQKTKEAVVPTVEAQSPRTLQLQEELAFRDHTTIRVVCNTANGDQYITFHHNYDIYRNGGVDLEVVKNGCPKNSK